MINILKIIAVIIAITYSLRLVNSQSDLLVFGGIAAVGVAVYVFAIVLYKIFVQLKSKL